MDQATEDLVLDKLYELEGDVVGIKYRLCHLKIALDFLRLTVRDRLDARKPVRSGNRKSNRKVYEVWGALPGTNGPDEFLIDIIEASGSVQALDIVARRITRLKAWAPLLKLNRIPFVKTDSERWCDDDLEFVCEIDCGLAASTCPIECIEARQDLRDAWRSSSRCPPVETRSAMNPADAAVYLPRCPWCGKPAKVWRDRTSAGGWRAGCDNANYATGPPGCPIMPQTLPMTTRAAAIRD